MQTSEATKYFTGFRIAQGCSARARCCRAVAWQTQRDSATAPDQPNPARQRQTRRSSATAPDQPDTARQRQLSSPSPECACSPWNNALCSPQRDSTNLAATARQRQLSKPQRHSATARQRDSTKLCQSRKQKAKPQTQNQKPETRNLKPETCVGWLRGPTPLLGTPPSPAHLPDPAHSPL